MRGLLYCGGGHTTMVHSTPAQDTAVFATPSVCGAVPAKTPSAGLGFPYRAAWFATAWRGWGVKKRKGTGKRIHPQGPWVLFLRAVSSAEDWVCTTGAFWRARIRCRT